jgi:hypothetical protein
MRSQTDGLANWCSFQALVWGGISQWRIRRRGNTYVHPYAMTISQG